MTESQSILNIPRTDQDRLTGLQLSLTHTILSLLPIKDAVKTSILSRQWRYTWTGLHKLVFEPDIKSKSYSEERLKNFISYALSIHKGSLYKFQLSAFLKETCPNMDEWLICLSTKDVRKLMLHISPFCDTAWMQSVHSSIYSYSKLIHLSLTRCEVGPPPPTFTGFLFLRHLDLHMVKISSTTCESIVSRSVLLETLIFDQYMPSEKEAMIRIHAPNLKYLLLLGCWIEIHLYAPLLAEMWVGLLPNKQRSGPLCSYNNILGGSTNLEKLTGYSQFTQVLSIGIESWNLNSLVFHRLRTIKLLLVDFRDVKVLMVLARLLIDAPNLQKLKILSSSLPEVPDVHYIGFGFEPNFRMKKLRVVKMVGVAGLIHEIKLIEFLLERSPLLERMIVDHIKHLGTEQIKHLLDKILDCGHASPSVKISISDGEH